MAEGTIEHLDIPIFNGKHVEFLSNHLIEAKNLGVGDGCCVFFRAKLDVGIQKDFVPRDDGV